MPTVISATRLKQPINKAPVSTTIIDSQMIRASGAQTVADLTPIMPKRDNTSLVDGVDGNILADNSEDGASLSEPTANKLVEGTGSDAGIGAALDDLIFIEENMVGPYSTWEAPAQSN